MKNHINIGTEEEPYWTPKMSEEAKKAWHKMILSQKLEVTYTQDNDCTEDSDHGQFLTISTANGGVGREHDFLVLETKRWSINDIEELIEILKDFKRKHENI